MFGLAQSSEKRQAKVEVLRAERAFDSALMQPLAIQQDIARHTLRECMVTTARLSCVSANIERQALYLLRLAELEQKIKTEGMESRQGEMEPSIITAIFTQTLLAISSGSRQGDGLEAAGEKIAQWSRNILPDFDRLQSELSH